MVHEMIAEQKAQMLKLLMEKVNEEVQHYSDSTDDAMSCFIGDMKSQFYDLMKVEIQREVSSQLQAKMADNKEEEKDGEKRDTCVPTAGRIFFRRDIFKKYEEAEEQSRPDEMKSGLLPMLRDEQITFYNTNSHINTLCIYLQLGLVNKAVLGTSGNNNKHVKLVSSQPQLGLVRLVLVLGLVEQL